MSGTGGELFLCGMGTAAVRDVGAAGGGGCEVMASSWTREKKVSSDAGDEEERSVGRDLCLENLLGDCELLELGEDLSEDGVAGRLGHGGGHGERRWGKRGKWGEMGEMGAKVIYDDRRRRIINNTGFGGVRQQDFSKRIFQIESACARTGRLLSFTPVRHY